MLDLLDGKELYKKVDLLRTAKNWTIYELAQRAGVASNTIYNWRDRGSSPSLSLLSAVCDAFGISVIAFLLDENELTALTKEQTELVNLWNTLSVAQKKSIINLMKSMQSAAN
ncbi:MAG: helix-turn-helix transcriptional regulator [Clostridia bacterium]|jgi:transcriptional regulator with XRE-family HTH domain|nr:helix-turn-helix transcriptional regulator [Clostridia bacterium]